MRVIYSTESEAKAADALALAADKARRIDDGIMSHGDGYDLTTITFSEVRERLDGKFDIEMCEHYDYGDATIEAYDESNYASPNP